jgi:hypothetical protein
VRDGAFEFDGRVVRGYQALREYADVHTGVMRGRHLTLNLLYEVHGDQATGRATTVVSIATPSGYKIMGQGAYEDDLVKVGGEWKIRHRRVKNDRLVSEPAKPINLAGPRRRNAGPETGRQRRETCRPRPQTIVGPEKCTAIEPIQRRARQRSCDPIGECRTSLAPQRGLPRLKQPPCDIGDMASLKLCYF